MITIKNENRQKKKKNQRTYSWKGRTKLRSHASKIATRSAANTSGSSERTVRKESNSEPSPVPKKISKSESLT